MPLDKYPAHDARRDPFAPGPRPPRALNPETGEPVPDLTWFQRLTLGVARKVIQPLITKWAPRQLLKVITVAATAIGASESDAHGTVAFLVAGISFLLELLLSRLSRRFLKLKS